MADTDWIAFWAERGVTIEPGSDKSIPGNGYVPLFSIERAESLGLTIDGAAIGADAAVAEAESVVADATVADEPKDDEAEGTPTA